MSQETRLLYPITVLLPGSITWELHRDAAGVLIHPPTLELVAWPGWYITSPLVGLTERAAAEGGTSVGYLPGGKCWLFSSRLVFLSPIEEDDGPDASFLLTKSKEVHELAA